MARTRSTTRGSLRTTGFVYDQGAPIGEIVLGSPHARLLDFRFHGTAAHAGMHPEDGRSAIAAASRAIADFRLGRVDEETSANVGRHHGRHGAQRRPGVVLVHGRGALARRAEGGRARAGDARERRVRREPRRLRGRVGGSSELPRLPLPRERRRPCGSPRRRSSVPATRRRTRLSGGGADANVFNARGLQCVNLANGMMEIHTPDEHIAVADLEGMVEVTLALVDAARASA